MEHLKKLHKLVAGGYAEAVRFKEFDSETVIDAGVYLDGQYDVSGSAHFFGGVSYDRLNESRRGYNSAFLYDEPINYSLTRAYGGYRQEFGRLRVIGQADITERDFDDADTVVGQVPSGLFISADQDFRDRTSIGIMGEVAYAVTRDTAIYFSAAQNWQDWDGADAVLGRERDSNGYRLTTGAEFDLSKLVRGRAGIGYFSQDFDDPSYDEIDGVAIDAALEWFPTDLTTVTLTADRGIDQSAIVSSSGFVTNEIMVGVDHELRRNLILSGFVAYGLDEYDDPILDNTGAPLLDGSGNVLEQEIDRWGAGLGAEYFMNRMMSVGVDYTFETQDVEFDVFSGGFETNYDIHQLLVTLTLQR